MIISTIQIKNYRSIKAAKVDLGSITVLLGKNNEGKSNLLMAINVAISTLQDYANMKRRRFYLSRYAFSNEEYLWERDYPVSEQKGKKRDKKTVFVLEFSLSNDEIVEFKKKIGNQLNGKVLIKICFDNTNKSEITVVKRGKGSKLLNENSRKVAKYIAEHIEYNYIPAVRTVDHTMNIIGDQVSARLQEARDKKEYQEALKIIANIEKKILLDLSVELQSALFEFLPDVHGVTLTSEDLGMVIRHRQEYVFMINDGEETDLKNKGDGVKSLVAMALLKNKKILSNTVSVIALEEPESHLHPSAIDALRKSILSLAEKSQVIITTHNPQFVNRNDISSNIIVEGGNAIKASNIRQIRETLGVKLSDNLFGAKLLLYVEGTTDRTMLNAILSHYSTKLADALNENTLVIQPMSGTDHLEMHLSSAKAMVADFFLLLDNDRAGEMAVRNAITKGYLSSQYMLTTFSDLVKESEIEDMLDTELNRQIVENTYGVLLSGKFEARNKKWSERIKDVFKESGKMFDGSILNEIKLKVAQKTENYPDKALRAEGQIFINNLISNIEKML